ncbi:MAG TPA: CHASE3 domain-containing protein [Opitutus sp.]|nr:CHASE3 domain-containing protein [Opitutus sp.]
MNDPAVRRVLAAFLLVCAVAIFAAIVAARNTSRAAATSDWVNHTHAVINEVEGIYSSVRVGEAALRAYVATGSATDRGAAREAFEEMSEHIELAKALTRQEPAQSEQVLAIAKMTSGRDELANSVLAAARSNSLESARALMARDDGLAVAAEIRRAVGKLRDDEMALLADRDTRAYLQAHTTRWIVWSGVALNFLLLAGAAWLIRDDLAARRRATAVLEEANARLETKVRERTAELSSANEQLSADNLERRWANEALEHQVHYSDLIISSVNDAVLVLTKALNISRINPAVVRLTGFEAPQLVNRPLRSIVTLRSQDAVAPAELVDPVVQALREGRDLRDLPAVVQDKLGRKTAVHCTVFPMRDRDKVIGGIVILRTASPT